MRESLLNLCFFYSLIGISIEKKMRLQMKWRRTLGIKEPAGAAR